MPTGLGGFAHQSETGVLPYIEVDAIDAESAARQAHALMNAPITETVRVDDPPPRLSRRGAQQPHFHIEVVKPDGTVTGLTRIGGQPIDHTTEGARHAGIGGLVRIRRIDTVVPA
jgi:hypothetical protein